MAIPIQPAKGHNADVVAARIVWMEGDQADVGIITGSGMGAVSAGADGAASRRAIMCWGATSFMVARCA